ncbi:MAG: hypothetical protein ABEI54_02415, partial [Candidatus Bipolaricaulia bacterium]
MDSIQVTRGDFAKADSLSDFDLVFIDPEGIDRLWTAHLTPQSDGKFRTNPKEDGGLANGLRNLMRARREELINLLEQAGGAIFCKLRKSGRELTVLTKDKEEVFNRYTWLPESEVKLFRSGQAVETRKGKRLSLRGISSPVIKFLSDFRESISYESVLKNQSLADVQTSGIFASTPTGAIASFGIVHGKGSLVFLPAGMELEVSGEEELVKAAEKVVRGGGYYSPSWLDNYCLPSEKDIRNQLKDI